MEKAPEPAAGAADANALPSGRASTAPPYHHRLKLELLTGLLTMLSIAAASVLMLDLCPEMLGAFPLRAALILVDTLCCVYFWWEYFHNLRTHPDQRAYVLTRSLWLLGAIPWLWPLRWLRIGRVLRFILIFRLSPQAREAWRYWVRALLHHPVDLLLIATALLLLGGSSLLYLVERGRGGTIHTWWDALWLAVTSATTDSYGDVAPVTPLGRIISISIAFLGIAIIGSLTAVITGYIIREPAPGEAETQVELRRIKRQLRRIERQLCRNESVRDGQHSGGDQAG
ncbi:two pore domain potassium channel family protein [bacterium]|nr:two pore domain potassium channel family protein [bacterium]